MAIDGWVLNRSSSGPNRSVLSPQRWRLDSARTILRSFAAPWLKVPLSRSWLPWSLALNLYIPSDSFVQPRMASFRRAIAFQKLFENSFDKNGSALSMTSSMPDQRYGAHSMNYWTVMQI